MQLGLGARGVWGGWRRNAGRKPIPRERRSYVPHITRPKVTKATPVHVTMRCVDGLPSLRRATHKQIILDIFAAENRKGFRLVHYSIQGNHLHLICEGDDTEKLSRGVQRVASRMARRLNERFGRRGKFFRERFHSQVIRGPKQMRNALRYVLLNLHKHGADQGELVDGFDPYSSSQFFGGMARAEQDLSPSAGDRRGGGAAEGMGADHGLAAVRLARCCVVSDS